MSKKGKGLEGWEKRLFLSDSARMVFDSHQAPDGLQEQQRQEEAGGKNGVPQKRALAQFILPKLLGVDCGCAIWFLTLMASLRGN